MQEKEIEHGEEENGGEEVCCDCQVDRKEFEAEYYSNLTSKLG